MTEATETHTNDTEDLDIEALMELPSTSDIRIVMLDNDEGESLLSLATFIQDEDATPQMRTRIDFDSFKSVERFCKNLMMHAGVAFDKSEKSLPI